MAVEAEVINKGLCLSSPQKERDLSVMISWSPKVFFSEPFKLLTKMRTCVLFEISEFCYLKYIGTST